MKKLLKFLYLSIPFKAELFQLLKFIYRPKQRIYKHLHFKGEFKVRLDRNKSFKIKHYGFVIENEIFWNGINDGWEKHSMRIWQKLCENSMVTLDIGANTGIYSLVAKTKQPKSEVYAFEPVERVFDKLKLNVKLNNYNVHCIRKAISDSNGKAFIYDTDLEHILSVTVNKNLNSEVVNTMQVEIETITLDTFIEENGIEHIDLMKIDVETHEVEVLKGFETYLGKFRPTMLIEILNVEVAKGVENIISEFEYRFFNINEEIGAREVKHLEPSDTFNFLVCSDEVAERIGLMNPKPTC